ncbi:MAG: class II SORL domain-containing protein [Desulfuromonadales bacterium]
MKRRQFIGQAISGAGAVLVAGPAVALAGGESDFTPYRKVDSDLFQGINRGDSSKEKSLLEKKHLPVIDLPDKVAKNETFEINVALGAVEHPMSKEHYIDYVELFAGNAPAGRVDFRPDFSVPQATFYVRLDKPVTLIARAYCNLHGLWESRTEIAPA